MSLLRSKMTYIIGLIGQWASLRSQILFISKKCPTCVCSCFESFNICLVIVIGLAAMANMLNGWKNDATCNKLNIRNAKNCNQSPDQSSVLSHNFCMPDTGHEGLGELGSSQFKLGSKWSSSQMHHLGTVCLKSAWSKTSDKIGKKHQSEQVWIYLGKTDGI